MSAQPQSAGKARAEIGMAIAVLMVVALLVVPLPPLLLDMCFAISIATSIVMLLVAL